jgi:hypothetical protein
MKAFDTDILTEILAGNPVYAERIANVPLEEQSAPIVAIEEVLRGRLNVIRQAEAGKARITIERAYQLFEETLDALRELKFLSFVDNLAEGVTEAELLAAYPHLKIEDVRAALAYAAEMTRERVIPIPVEMVPT